MFYGRCYYYFQKVNSVNKLLEIKKRMLDYTSQCIDSEFNKYEGKDTNNFRFDIDITITVRKLKKLEIKMIKLKQ